MRIMPGNRISFRRLFPRVPISEIRFGIILSLSIAYIEAASIYSLSNIVCDLCLRAEALRQISFQISIKLGEYSSVISIIERK